MAIPWRSIFTSLPVWGIVLGHAASNWGNYTLNQQLPTYLTDVLRFDLSYTGLLSSMCYVLQWIGRATLGYNVNKCMLLFCLICRKNPCNFKVSGLRILLFIFRISMKCKSVFFVGSLVFLV
jgi:hypothetical protein